MAVSQWTLEQMCSCSKRWQQDGEVVQTIQGFGGWKEIDILKCQWRKEAHLSPWYKQCGKKTAATQDCTDEPAISQVGCHRLWWGFEGWEYWRWNSWKRVHVWRLKLRAVRNLLRVCSLLLLSSVMGQRSIRVSGLVLIGTYEILKDLSFWPLVMYCGDEGRVSSCDLMAISNFLILLSFYS